MTIVARPIVLLMAWLRHTENCIFVIFTVFRMGLTILRHTENCILMFFRVSDVFSLDYAIRGLYFGVFLPFLKRDSFHPASTNSF